MSRKDLAKEEKKEQDLAQSSQCYDRIGTGRSPPHLAQYDCRHLWAVDGCRGGRDGRDCTSLDYILCESMVAASFDIGHGTQIPTCKSTWCSFRFGLWRSSEVWNFGLALDWDVRDLSRLSFSDKKWFTWMTAPARPKPTLRWAVWRRTCVCWARPRKSGSRESLSPVNDNKRPQTTT